MSSAPVASRDACRDACRDGNLEVVKELLRVGADVNCTPEYTDTPIWKAHAEHAQKVKAMGETEVPKAEP
jgi:Ankyrin repeats (many copies)